MGAKRAGPTKTRLTRDQHELEIHPNDDAVSSDVTLKLVASNIDTKKAKLTLRRMRETSKGGVLIFADSAADLDRQLAGVEKSDLAKDHTGKAQTRDCYLWR